MSDVTRKQAVQSEINVDKYSGTLSTAEKLTPEVFDSHVGQKFRVTHRRFETEQTHIRPLHVTDAAAPEAEPMDQFVELELVEVTRYPNLEKMEGGFDDRPREPFSLLFVGPHGLPLMSAQHTVHHDELGSGQLFFSPVQVTLKHPVERHPDGRFYEVAFC